ncbi:MAG: TauD/TfdA family dioxygenase [Novosphingobium sp.]|nr:TauD/TfdA family dioxygenase [Novosphingobium sp.]
MQIEKIKEHIGGLVHVDKADICSDDVVAQLREALEERGVLVFPKINLTDEEQIAFTEKFGERVKFTGTVPGGEGDGNNVYKITLDEEINTEPDYVLGTFFWHMDGVTIDQPLPKATFLSSRATSAEGGETEFCSTYAGYETLSDEMKAKIEGLQVIHRVEAAVRPIYREQSAERLERYRSMADFMVQPLVWQHPSGRKSLILGTHADEIVGMTIPEGRSLLARLMEWTAQPDFSYSHKWSVGDFVMWDNHGAMHRVVPYDKKSGRMMHRTTIFGKEKPGMKLKEFEAA